jgi:hypothetical protein
VIPRVAEERKLDRSVIERPPADQADRWLTHHIVDQLAQEAARALLTAQCPFPEKRPGYP